MRALQAATSTRDAEKAAESGVLLDKGPELQFCIWLSAFGTARVSRSEA